MLAVSVTPLTFRHANQKFFGNKIFGNNVLDAPEITGVLVWCFTTPAIFARDNRLHV